VRIEATVRSGIPALTDALRGEGSQIVRKATFDVSARTKVNIAQKYQAVDTAFMLNSVGERIVSPFEGESYVGAEYGPYVHNGANGREPRPFQDDAVEEVMPTFERAVEGLFDKANRSVP
jgi:hypothetical protein